MLLIFSVPPVHNIGQAGVARSVRPQVIPLLLVHSLDECWTQLRVYMYNEQGDDRCQNKVCTTAVVQFSVDTDATKPLIQIQTCALQTLPPGTGPDRKTPNGKQPWVGHAPYACATHHFLHICTARWRFSLPLPRAACRGAKSELKATSGTGSVVDDAIHHPPSTNLAKKKKNSQFISTNSSTTITWVPYNTWSQNA